MTSVTDGPFHQIDFKFADCESSANAMHALECSRNGVRSAFLVTGPPRSGKSSFVYAALAGRFGVNTSVVQMPSNEDHMMRALSSFVGLGYVHIDGVHGKFRYGKVAPLSSSALECFITSPTWSWRAHRRNVICHSTNNCVVFLVGCEVELSTDLAHRVKVIRMADPAEFVSDKLSTALR